MTYIIGTAGHVDHGKSTLIEAITGTHPDRLREERLREMSIVLGFDSFQLPDGKAISVVDVPGHRDFIENMLSGIGSIDACLLVIAADEGVMPQTKEHLDILHLLEVSKGVIALTKIDLVDDSEWLDLVEIEIHELLSETALKEAPIVRVSAKTKTGIDDLLSTLGEVLEDQPPRLDLGRPRLSVDRVFLMSGFGSVVTGTLLDGTLHVGDEILLLPDGIKGRIRGLQNHSQEVQEIGPGNRVAVNISGIDQDAIQRGDVVIFPGTYDSTRRLDVRFQHLASLEKPIHHDQEVKLFLGADEATARIRLLGQDFLLPGSEGWLQLEINEPVVAVRGDRYILRRPSPSETLGGGVIVDPHPGRRHKRFDDQVLERLEALTGGDPKDILIQILNQEGVMFWEDLTLSSGLEKTDAAENLEELSTEGIILTFGKEGKKGKRVALQGVWNKLLSELVQQINSYHQLYPLKPGMPLEELKSQSSLVDDVFREAVGQQIKAGLVVQSGPNIRRFDFEVLFNDAQEKLIEGLLEQFSTNPTQPPSVADCMAAVGEDLYQALVGQERLKQVSSEVVFSPDAYQKMVDKITERLKKEGTITVAQARDMFGSTRKYILALLEHLDTEGITIREGDDRRLKE
jgi:selenocysteine-specific elongation factor